MKHILVVDDYHVNGVMIQKALEGKYQISIATSGEEALDFIKSQKPDLVILDIQMPEMNGLQVLENLRNNGKTKELPVIFLTTQTDRENITKGFALGVTDIIAKPIIMANIENRIKAAFEQAKKRQQNKLENMLKDGTKAEPVEVDENAFEKEFLMNDEWKDFFR